MPKYRVRVALGAVMLVSAAAVLGQASRNDADESIVLESDSISIDRKSNVTTYDGLRIDAGRWRLVADKARAHAESLNFRRGEWQFEGGIEVVIEASRITADRAAFTFSEQELVTAELWGTPVTFEDAAPKREDPIIGHSEHARFDNRAGTIELLGTVSLTMGPYETTGCDLVYFLDSESFTTGSAECGQPFRTIIPREREQTSESGADTAP